jgi:hypothetical protein
MLDMRAFVGYSAADMRAAGFVVPTTVPDCAVIRVGEDGRAAYEWVKIEADIDDARSEKRQP